MNKNFYVKLKKGEVGRSYRTYLTSISQVGRSLNQCYILGNIPSPRLRASYKCISCKLGEVPNNK